MRKFLSILLCLIMITSIISGCGPQNANQTNTAQPAGSKEPAAKIDLANKPTLHVLMAYGNFDPNTDVTAKYLEEATGYKVQYDMLPSEDMLTKISAILASKQEYDIISLMKSEFDSTVDTGAYRSINDLLSVYGTDIKAKTAEGLWTNVTIDGEVKGIPEGYASENYGLVYRVRMDMLKKAGIQTMPATIDEFYTALKAVKEKLNIIPLTTKDALIPEISSAFGIYNDLYSKFNLVDNKIVYHAEMPGAKDYVAFLNKLYSEGLLDNEYAQNTGEVMREKFFTGKAAIYQMGWWNEPTATKTISEKAPEAEVAYLPPLKNAAGVGGVPMIRGVNRVHVIPKVSKNPEHALNYINTKFNDEIFKKANMGEEGVHYKDLGNNKYEPILPKFFDDKSNASNFLTGTDTEQYSVFWKETRIKKNETLYKEFNIIQDMVKQFPRHYDPTTYMQPNKVYSDSIGKVNKFAEDSYKQFITGTRPMSEWDAFIKELHATGLDQINKSVNEWWAKEGAALKDKMTQK